MLNRRITLAAVAAAVLIATGCATSTESATRYDKRPTDPIALSSVRVIFVETDYKLTGERPWLTSAQVNEQRAMLSKAFLAEFPKAMQAAGVTAQVKSFPDTIEFSSPEVRQWIGTWPAQPHLLIVTPAGGKVFCTGGRATSASAPRRGCSRPMARRCCGPPSCSSPTSPPSLKLRERRRLASTSAARSPVCCCEDTTAKPRP